MLLDKNDLNSCSLSYTFGIIVGKWKPFIIWYLFKSETGVCRYGELKRLVPWDISHKMFFQQLKELEEADIIVRTEYDEKPPRVEYSLTEAGRLLAPAILYLRDWGAAFGNKWTENDLLDRTLGKINGNTIKYEYSSDELRSSVSIDFKTETLYRTQETADTSI